MSDSPEGGGEPDRDAVTEKATGSSSRRRSRSGAATQAADAPTHRSLLSKGDRIGVNIEVHGFLAAGGMSKVWRAHHAGFDRPVALKIPPEEVCESEDASKLLLKEARRLAKLKHPAIAEVLDCGRVADWSPAPLTYVSMELLEGPTLASHLSDHGPLSLDETVAILTPLAEALDHAHAQGFVHRDVKPGNVMFHADPAEGGQPKLIDFGLAGKMEDAASRSGVTLTGSEDGSAGTPPYMSPEQIRAGKPKSSMDVWGLAVVAYEMLADRLPFPSQKLRQQQILEHQPDPLDGDDNEGLDEATAAAVSEVLLWGLAKDPAARPASPVELVAALAKVASGEGFVRPVDEAIAVAGSSVEGGGAPPRAAAASGQPGAGKQGGGMGRALLFLGLIAAGVLGADHQLRLGWVFPAAPATPTSRPATTVEPTPTVDPTRAPPTPAVPSAQPPTPEPATPVAPSPVAPTPSPPQDGRLTLTSSPSGAKVFVLASPGGSGVPQGKYLGKTGEGSTDPLPPGAYRLKFALTGYDDAEASVNVAAGQTWIASATLKKAATPHLTEGTRPGQEVTNALGMKLCWIPPGSFMMGSPKGQDPSADDERRADGSRHRVTLAWGFWMGKYEVTQGEYQKVVGKNPAKFQGSAGDDRRPVEQVNWNEAVAFCETLTARERKAGRLPADWVYALPSEAQWEYAARGGVDRPIYEGTYRVLGRFEAPGLDPLAWHGGNSASSHPHAYKPSWFDEGMGKAATQIVGRKRANAWGLHDVLGNVWEWCADPWHSNYTGAPSGGQVWTSGGDDSYRVLRGGSWNGDAKNVRVANRINLQPESRLNLIGFRVVARPRTF